MNEKQSPYFIAIIPPAGICEEIAAFKKDFFERFGSRAALKVIPHITLKAPFKLPVSGHDGLLKWFRQLSVNTEPFTVELKDFGVFPTSHSPVVYINVRMKPGLYALQKEIMAAFGPAYPQAEITEQELSFHPHITIAYRDLHPDRFREAWKEYGTKKYSAIFSVNEFLLLQHNEKQREILDTCTLHST